MEQKIMDEVRARVVGNMLGKIDKALAELEEKLLKERIASDPKLMGKEITPELREELLEEIREHCRNLEE